MTLSLDYSHPPYSVGTGCTDPWKLNGTGAFDYGYPSVGAGDFTLVGTPADVITWQGQGGPCGPTPAKRATWGMVKSLYR